MRHAAARLWTRLGLLCACVAAAATEASAQTYYWSAFAGLPPQLGTTDGVGLNARFQHPTGIVNTTTGVTYVCDSGNHTLRRVAADGTVTTVAGSPGNSGAVDGVGSAARFSFPRSVTILRGYYLVADYNNHAIRRVAPDGTVVTVAGRLGVPGTVDGAGTSARFNKPGGIDQDGAENIYVADTGNHVIRKISPEGEVTTLAGAAGVPGSIDGPAATARFNAPTGLYVTASGVIYVADTQNHVIRRIGTDGMVTTLAGMPGVSGTANGTGSAARFRYPAGVVAYSDGTVLVSDEAHAIRLISPAGVVATYAGRSGVEGSRDGSLTDARFNVPLAISFHPNGVMVADSYNHSLRLLSISKREVTTIAGSPGNFGRVDGIGSEARFNFPTGVAAHPSGDIYLADARSNSIRRILPDGRVIRIAGQPEGDAYVDGPAAVQSLNYPYALAVTADRTVYFCEQQRHTVRVLRPDGSVATLAGGENSPGAVNGAGEAARFNCPSGIALDREGNLYVSDTNNHTIRRIAAGTNVVTTFAGAPGISGTADGTTQARFFGPRGLATDAQGNVYVADTNNYTIRKITRDGEVSTLAGLARTPGTANGSGAIARFGAPVGIAADAEGTLYVTDVASQTIRKIIGDTVSTIAGVTQGSGFREGSGGSALFNDPNGITVDANGTIYLAESGNNIVRRGEIMARPTITVEPASQAVAVDSTATLSVSASGGGLRYQWQRNGVLISGATSATYAISNANAASAGDYRVTVTNSLGSIGSATATLTVGPASTSGRLINLSILSAVGEPGDSFTLGFVVGGAGTAGTKPLLIRAAGPALGALGVPDTLPDPRLELFSGSVPSGSNDNWGGRAELAGAMRNVGAFAYPDVDSRDAAAVGFFPSGNASVKVSGVGNATGSVIAEIYDATPSSAFSANTPRLVNVSVLKHLGSGLVAGFAIGGSQPKKVLIRAIGPTLGAAPFGVDGVVADPQLTLFSGQTPVGSNDNWRGTAELAAAFTQVGAFSLPADSRDAALIATLNPGPYTVEVNGVGGTTGVALVEVYEVP